MPINFYTVASTNARQLRTGLPGAPPALVYFPGDGLQTTYTPAPLIPLPLSQMYPFPRLVPTYYANGNWMFAVPQPLVVA